EIDKKLYEIIIDELNLPSRVINALLREKIETVADLIKVGKDRLVEMKGVGKKSIQLIEDELKKMGVQI
ncbi:helix-hairpin-helix domain-containing protein, partial [Patescibacteria group bacterium]|nr:helix-hairpin-helix domain-containing protein [Patescibacteria group bacterium]